MDKCKIDNMKKDKCHFVYDSLSDSEVTQLMSKIEVEYHTLAINKNNLFTKMYEILKKTIELPTINEAEGFEDLCAQLNIILPSQDYAYVIWNYDSIDKVRICDLKMNWDYIWYGPADEFCLLYFPSLHLLVMIADYGVVYTA